MAHIYFPLSHLWPWLICQFQWKNHASINCRIGCRLFKWDDRTGAKPRSIIGASSNIQSNSILAKLASVRFQQLEKWHTTNDSCSWFVPLLWDRQIDCRQDTIQVVIRRGRRLFSFLAFAMTLKTVLGWSGFCIVCSVSYMTVVILSMEIALLEGVSCPQQNGRSQYCIYLFGVDQDFCLSYI